MNCVNMVTYVILIHFETLENLCVDCVLIVSSQCPVLFEDH